MVRLSMRLAFVILVSGPALADDVPFAVAPDLHPRSNNAYVPGLGEIMQIVQLKHIKLWQAGSSMNWRLAAFEVDQIRDVLLKTAIFYDGIPATFVIAADAPLQAMKEATAAGDRRAYEAGYARLTETCNACHEACARRLHRHQDSHLLALHGPAFLSRATRLILIEACARAARRRPEDRRRPPASSAHRTTWGLCAHRRCNPALSPRRPCCLRRYVPACPPAPRFARSDANRKTYRRCEERLAGPALRFACGNELFGEGDDAEDVFRVVSGVVRTCRFQSDGRRQICAFHSRGDVFGFEPGTEYSLSAEAVSDCTVVPYRRNRLERSAIEDRRLSVLLFSYAIQSLARARDHALLLGRRSAVGKMAAFLVESAERSADPVVVDLAMTRQDIADYLGLTIETVSRTFTHFERDALIQLPTSRRVRLVDLPRLRRLDACEEGAAEPGTRTSMKGPRAPTPSSRRTCPTNACPPPAE